MKKTNSLIAIIIIISCLGNIFAQSKTSSIWIKASANQIATKSLLNNNSYENSEFYELNVNLLKSALQNAPLREKANGFSNIIVDFPIGNGELVSFKIMEAPVMHPDLAAKYPSIKSYVGYGVSTPHVIRFSLSNQKGLSCMLIPGVKKPVFIEPFTSDMKTYVVYSRTNETRKNTFECLTDDVPYYLKKNISSPSNQKDANDQTLRKFRLAMSATGEYTAYHGGTKAGALAAINTTMTRVNGVYEADFAITMELIANTDDVIYTNGGIDPYGSNLNSELQSTLTSVITEAAYDIGHLVHQESNSNGNAGCIGCVCVDGSKGSGFTSHVTPEGDDFDIDFVAHEMGHQFGGNHTFTHSSEGTGVQMEPGSGSTIMGYAGITGASDVQPHSDPYFHFATIEQVTNYVGTTSCQTTTSLTNNVPTADAGNDYIIPNGTAFILEGAGTDADLSDVLTFCWEQADEGFGSSTSVSPTSAGSPSFRSFLPITSPNRYMPKLDDVVNGTLSTQWETVLTVPGTMNFALTVRDNVTGGGQNKIDKMIVTVDANGPFVVTSQNTSGLTLNSGASETITWDVAGTNTGAVNTPNVDIFLSIDGGFTYPFTLATGVPNNGSASVTIPTGAATTNGRIMVRGSGNIFYALNSNNFTIEDSEFVMNFSNTNASPCPTQDAVYNFTYNTFLSFSENTTFSASGNPAGSTVTFNPTTATTNGTLVTVTVSGLNASMVGSYSIAVTGTSSSVTKIADLTLDVIDPSPSSAALTSPTDASTGIDPGVTFNWTASGVGAMYDIDIATDAAFTTIIDNATSLTTNSYVSSSLVGQTTYYWRVTSYNNCGSAPASTVFSFTTSSCTTVASTDIPVSISASGTPTITSTLNVVTSGNIVDLNVLNLTGTHTWINDLTVTLTSPQSTTVTLWDGICNSEDNFNLNLDDAAAPGALPCPPVGGGTYQPSNPLSVFNGENMNGIWTLSITDGANQDGGSLDGWGLEICADAITVGIDQNNTINSLNIYPNPTSNILNVALGKYNSVNQLVLTDLQGKIVFEQNNINTSPLQIDMSGYGKGVYLLQLKGQDESKIFKVTKQ
ncbi:T9SS type A sorting domain-containing protein [Vicingus serpentipes]|uniref:T9SS type A sorting domain-containing protein n=1 Tax=Vicingus serpentipes TaxID=1926625 RepID=A0A5C6RRZ2_9FLAO|nr:zinc-dependent metalloprotease family protein [Vicingus serpentipes]TXB64724.1 T9SS type A sorting domain-containing protein [Vicingus serpentipes]